MEIKKPCNLEKLYGHTHPIDENSPELLFMKAVCEGKAEEALSFFREEKLFGGVKSAVDAPYGRFEGIDGIRAFISGWLNVFEADSAFVTPVIQTRANGRVALEAVINFVEDNAIKQVPMFIIGDFRTASTLDEVRLYCHHTFISNLQAYRKPMFASAHLEIGDPGLLTGAVREYYEALHHFPSVDVDRILGCIGENCVFGGYEKWGSDDKPGTTKEEIRVKYEHMKEYIPRCVGMRYETIIDDGRTCVIEWVHIVSKAGQEERARIALSGIAAYERGDDGLLCSIRISDYAGYERTIDWSKLDITQAEAKKINDVEQMPSSIGAKKLG